MKRYLADIEADNLLDKVTKIWCGAVLDLDTNEVFAYRPYQIHELCAKMQEADVLYGQNFITYDAPVLDKIMGYPVIEKPWEIIDTLILARMMFPSIRDSDFILVKQKILDAKLIGSHSLKAWGQRLGEKKGSFGEEHGFEKWHPEMLDYCIQDLHVNAKMLRRMEADGLPPQKAIEIEMRFQYLAHQMEMRGCPFNREMAEAYYNKLESVGSKVFSKIKTMIPDKTEVITLYPARSNAKIGAIKGQPFVKTVTHDFNPRSGDQIAQHFIDTYGWVPTKYTEKNKIAVDGDVLSSLPYPEAKKLKLLVDIDKVQEKLKGSKKALMENLTPDGRVHGSMNTLGAVTARCTHFVISNMPMELKHLFAVQDPWRMVGCDAKGIELRLLAHYMHPYDDGEYAKIVVDGDIHTHHQNIFGLESRNTAKTFIYAFLYGAGRQKLGSIIDPKARPKQQTSLGAEAMQTMQRNLPALGQLIADVKHTFDHRGYLFGIDGRKLYPRGSHTALNTLIQNAGAVLMKHAPWLMVQELEKSSICADMVIHYHDEYNWICEEFHAKGVAEIANESITKAAIDLGIKVKMEGEAKIGLNWKEIH